MPKDVIVLGAGIIGVSVAIHLAERGRSVVLLDRRGAGEETSHGNAGLIQREGVVPYGFPQQFSVLLRHARNRSTDSAYHLSALPGIVPFLARYWWHSRLANHRRIQRLYEPLLRYSIAEHSPLIEKAGADGLMRKTGWIKAFSTQRALNTEFVEADRIRTEFGVNHVKLDAGQLAALEPALRQPLAGAVHWTDPWSVADPNGLVQAYLALFESLGGTFVRGDATSLRQSGAGWRVTSSDGPLEAASAVVALGPWSEAVTKPLGYRLPLAVKRGYHMHYQPSGEAVLHRPLLDAEAGYALIPTPRGLRITTGVEFAKRDSPATPVQLERAETIARRLIALGERIDPHPWLGARPCTPDMMPIIGPAPRHAGLWFAFGHAHHGLTLGPITGRLLAEQMTGGPTVVDPTPYLPQRFG